MAIPQIVSGSEVQTPGSRVKMDAGPLRQAALARGQLGAAVAEDVGGFFQDLADKMQANKNARTVLDADLTMRKTKDEFTAQLAKMPDEASWVPTWQQHTKEVKDAVMNGPNVGPDVKRILSQKFDVWEAATTGEIRTASMMKSATETRNSAIADGAYSAHQGDLPGAINALHVAVEHGVMTPEEAHKYAIHYPSIAAQAQADTIISSDPIHAPEAVKQFEKTIEPHVYLALVHAANSAKNRQQAANTNQIAEDMENSPDGTYDPKLLKAKVESGDITQKAADGLLAKMEKSNLKGAKDNLAVLAMQAHDHDWTEDPNPEQTAREMKDDAVGLPAALRLRFNNQVDSLLQRAKQKGKNEEKPVEADIFSRGRQDFTNGLFTPQISETVSHWYGSDTQDVRAMTPTEAEKEFGAKPADEKASAQLNYARWQDKMREFFRVNPKATSEEAEKESQRLMAPHVFQTVARALTPPTAPKSEFVEGAAYTDVNGNRATYLGGDPKDPKSWREMK